MLVGVPSVFLRLSGCNLRCKWCDTPYASWEPEGDHLMLGTVLADVRSRWSTHVVVTGGEPMIAPDDRRADSPVEGRSTCTSRSRPPEPFTSQ